MKQVLTLALLLALPLALHGQSNVSGGSGSAGTVAIGCTSNGVNPTRCPNGINTATNGDYEEYTVDTGGVTAGLALCATSSVDAAGRPKVLACSHTAPQPGSGFVGIAKSSVAAAGTVAVCWTVNCSATFDNGSTALNEAILSATTDGQLHDTGAQTATAGQPNFAVLAANAGAGTAALISLTGMLAQNPKGGGGNGKNGVSSLTGDGIITNNSASTGAVTITRPTENPNLFYAGPQSSSVSNLVQSNHTATLGSPTTVAFSSTVGATHLLVVAYAAQTNAGAVVSSTQSDSFSSAISTTASNVAFQIVYACSAVGGATTINITNLTGYAIVHVFEFSGNATSTCLDTPGNTAHSPGGGAENSTTATTGGSVAQATELVFAFFGQDTGGTLTACSASGAFTNQFMDTSSTANHACGASALGSATTGLSGAQSVTFTNNSSGGAGGIVAGIATFKLNTTGASTPSFRSIVNGDLPLHTPNPVFFATAASQTSAVSDTQMYAVIADGGFRFNGEVNCSTSVSTATATLNLKWTDTSNTAQTLSVTGTCTTLGAASVADMVHSIRAKSGTAITYGVTIANSPHFDVQVFLEQLN